MAESLVKELQPSWKFDNYELIDPYSFRVSLEEQNLGGYADQFWGLANSYVDHRDFDYGHGYILLDQTTLTTITTTVGPLHSPIHTLTINDNELDDGDPPLPSEGRFIGYDRLAAINCRGIGAGYDAGGFHEIAVGSIFLVELVDIRYFAKWTTIKSDYNWMDFDGTAAATQTYQQIITEIWNDHLLALMGPLSFRENMIDAVPADYRFVGMSAWDAIRILLQDSSSLLTRKVNGTWEVQANITQEDLPAADQALLDKAKDRYLNNVEGGCGLPFLPEKVEVFYHHRDFRYQDSSDDEETPQDYFQNEEFYKSIIYDTDSDLLPGANVVPDTTMPLWAPFRWVFTDDQGNDNSTDIDDYTKEYATQRIKRMYKPDDETSYTFSGVWPIELGTVFSSRLITDYGDGTFTVLTTEESPDTFPSESTGPPDVTRKHTPYTRLVYGKTLGPSDPIPAKGTIVTEGSLDAGGVETAHAGSVLVLYSTISAIDATEEWRSAGFAVAAYNFSLTTMPYGKPVYCHYHYQTGQHGVWHIVVGPSAAGFGAQLARAYAQIPARATQTAPGFANVRPVFFNAGTGQFEEEGIDLQVLSWVQSPSQDPTVNQYGYIYVWIEQDDNGVWFWTGEDCPPVDPGDPIQQQGDGFQIPGNSNTVILS